MGSVLERTESCIDAGEPSARMVEAIYSAVAETEFTPATCLVGPGWYRLTYTDYYNRNVTRVHHVLHIMAARQLARYGARDEIIVVTSEQWIPLEQISRVEAL